MRKMAKRMCGRSTKTSFFSSSDGNFTCFQSILTAYDTGERTCRCRAACSEFDFGSLVTSSTWPSNQYWQELATSMNYSIPADPGQENDLQV